MKEKKEGQFETDKQAMSFNKNQQSASVICLAVLLTAIISACQMNQFQFPGEPAVRTMHADCKGCHGTSSPSPDSLFPAGIDPSNICLKCHKDYDANHHPFNITPVGLYAGRGSDFPLYEGEIRCLTCHDAHSGPGLAETPLLLRGGLYTDRRTICFKCHYGDDYAQINPHVMLKSDGSIKDINGKPVCLICHAVKPNPEVDRTEDVLFRADVAFLCWLCHPPMPDRFFQQHFLVRPSKDTLRNMKQTEREWGVLFPLVPRQRITCSTCHNPHQKEVILHEPARVGADSRSRVRMENICTGCHKMAGHI